MALHPGLPWGWGWGKNAAAPVIHQLLQQAASAFLQTQLGIEPKQRAVVLDQALDEAMDRGDRGEIDAIIASADSAAPPHPALMRPNG